MTVRSVFAIFFLLVITGCKQDSIQTYVAPKDAVTMPPVVGDGPAVPGSATQGQPHVTWKTPDGWLEQPASSMRVGSFLIKGSNGQTADVSVVPLSGDAGGDLANINRWRGQIQLPPLSDEDLAQQSRTLTSHGRSMRWVDFVSTPKADGSSLKRITATIYKRGDQTWFFKMTGDDAVVHAAQPAFRAFLNSLQFPDHD
jgi:hypothetical protein